MTLLCNPLRSLCTTFIPTPMGVNEEIRCPIHSVRLRGATWRVVCIAPVNKAYFATHMSICGETFPRTP